MSCLDLTSFLNYFEDEEEKGRRSEEGAKPPLDYGKKSQNFIHQTLEIFHLAH
jgi:hypothetical protein